MMHLKIALPSKLVYEGEIRKISFEAVDGTFTMLPRHIDFVSALIPGILYFEPRDEQPEEVFFAVDQGLLVKQGRDVLVSTHNAVRSADLGSLHRTIQDHFKALNEQERQAHAALTRLEADFIHRYLEIEDEF